jgi:hypothetical protein
MALTFIKKVSAFILALKLMAPLKRNIVFLKQNMPLLIGNLINYPTSLFSGITVVNKLD